ARPRPRPAASSARWPGISGPKSLHPDNLLLLRHIVISIPPKGGSRSQLGVRTAPRPPAPLRKPTTSVSLSSSQYREALLRQGAGREPDQGAQAAPHLRPHLLSQSYGQPVPAVDPHRRLLAAADPTRLGAAYLVLA